MKIHNPNNLKTIDYRSVLPLQGELKNLSKENFTKLKNVLEKRGFYVPLFLWQNDGKWYLLDGHQRFRVMQTEKMNDEGSFEVPYIEIEADSEQEAKEKLLEITSQYGTITYEGFDAFIADLPEAEVVEAVHFDALPLLGQKEEVEVEEDEAPEVDEGGASASVVGEIYQLGRHRVMCGNSMRLEDVDSLMSGAKADMVLTDPPYNTGMSKKTNAGSTWLNHMFDDSFSDEDYHALLVDTLANMNDTTKGEAVFYVCIDWKSLDKVLDAFDGLLPVSNVIVWDKMVHGLGSDYKYTYELIVVAKKGKPEINNRIGTDYQDVWHVQRVMGRNDDHATAKPISLLTKPILHASKEDDIVLDLFGGSGSTLIACEQLSRICYMMELDPKYVDVIRKRYWKFTHDGDETGWEEGTPNIAGEKRDG